MFKRHSETTDKITQLFIPTLLSSSRELRAQNTNLYCYDFEVRAEQELVIFKKQGSRFRTLEQLLYHLSKLPKKATRIFVLNNNQLLALGSVVTAKTLEEKLGESAVAEEALC